MASGGFKGFQQTGSFETTVKPTNMFAGFPSTDFGGTGNIGGIPSSNLVAWFRPDINITLSGSNVSQWQDTTGTYSLTASGTAQPAYIQGDQTYNGRPYLSFNGTSNNLRGGNILSIGTLAQMQMVAIIKYNASTAKFGIISAYNDAAGYYALFVNGTAQYGIFKDTVQNNSSISGPATTNIHINSLEIDRTAGKIYYSNDSNWRGGQGTCVANTTNYNSNDFSIGADSSDGFCNCYIFDIFIYQGGLLSQSDYLMLRAYMGQLYNF